VISASRGNLAARCGHVQSTEGAHGEVDSRTDTVGPRKIGGDELRSPAGVPNTAQRRPGLGPGGQRNPFRYV